MAALRENIERVGLGGDVVATDVLDFLEGDGGRYDLAFVDPPYDLPLASLEEVLKRLVDQLNPGAVVIIHRRVGEAVPAAPESLALTWERQYGDAVVRRFTWSSGGDGR